MSAHVSRLPASGTHDPHVALLHDSVAFAALGMAILKTMGRVLPDAAHMVERATKDLSERFMTLALHAEAQGEIVQRVIAYAESVGGDPAQLSELTDQSNTVSRQIADTICGMIMGLQFQDRNSQIIENAVRVLAQLSAMLEELRNRSLLVQGDGLSCAVASIIAETVLETIRIGDIRQQFLQELANAHIPLEGHTLEQSDPDNAELF